ncbi:MAG: ribose 5-phosphate isomerase A [Candidatus Dormibacteraeota bacterium]|nr:ribose 5-phosphate isomerase A [Candidatus Dormibacteraeota bacterium]
MLLGLGTGSTAAYFIAGLAGMDVRCVASSVASREQAEALGLAMIDDPQATLDLTVDGADEIDPDLGLIKGRGGALFREKLLAVNSERFVVVADESKLVKRLGVGVLPVEVLAFLWRRTGHHLSELGYAWQLRGGEDAPYRTDNGNLILDIAAQGGIQDPLRLGADLKLVPGVCEHGLFIGLASAALIAGENGVRMLGAIE